MGNREFKFNLVEYNFRYYCIKAPPLPGGTLTKKIPDIPLFTWW